jgi:hypothetical protein
MVRRGSTVRVRQRAFFDGRIARNWAVFVAEIDTVEHLLRMEERRDHIGGTGSRTACKTLKVRVR